VSAVEYRYVALAVVALVVLYALNRYHKRRGVELEQAHAEKHGWEKLTLAVRQDVWECPNCGALFRNFGAVQTHRFALTSPCAEHQDRLAAAEQQERLEDAGAAAEQAGRWSVTATVGGEVHTGAVDSWARPELESGAEDD